MDSQELKMFQNQNITGIKELKTKDEFVKLFVENIEYIGKKLDSFEFKTLFFILQKIDYQNSLVIDSTFKKILVFVLIINLHLSYKGLLLDLLKKIILLN